VKAKYNLVTKAEKLFAALHEVTRESRVIVPRILT
jgi:hypothetical protein